MMDKKHVRIIAPKEIIDRGLSFVQLLPHLQVNHIGVHEKLGLALSSGHNPWSSAIADQTNNP